MAGDIWEILGIARTTDQRAIRSAYAAKLKSIDVDGDPASFIALRDAYEWAREDARYAAYDDWDEDDFGVGAGSEDNAENLSAADNDTDVDAHIIAGDFGGQSDSGDFDDAIAAPPQPAEQSPVDVDTLAAGNGQTNADYEDESDAAPSAENPWAEPSGHDLYDAMSDLLYHAQQRNRNLLEDEYNKLRDLTDSFIRWLDNATIDEARDYEFALAHLMANTIPRSDVMLYKIPAYFGWENSAGNYDVPEQVEILLERRDANSALTRLLDPQHRLNAAYKALTSPTESPRKNGQLRMEVRELIASARTHHPSLLAAFDYDRLAEWEKTLQIGDWRPGTEKAEAEKTNWVSYWWVGVILFALLRLCSAAVPSGNDNANDRDASGTFAQIELSIATNEIFGNEISYPDLQKQNPLLAQTMAAEWRTNVSNIIFEIQIKEIFGRMGQEQLPTATPDQLRSYWALWTDKAALLQKISPNSCVSFISGNLNSYKFPSELQMRDQKIMRDLLLPLQPKLADGKASINSAAEIAISGKIIGQVIDKSKLPEAVVRAALQSKKGSDGVRCTVSIALGRILSESRSAEALDLMRRLLSPPPAPLPKKALPPEQLVLPSVTSVPQQVSPSQPHRLPNP